MRQIDADNLLNEMEAGCIPVNEKGISGILGDESCIKDYIDNAPTIEAPCEQIKWERDTAIKQLESYGVKFCEQAEVRKVVHGRNITTEHPVDEFICSECNIHLTNYVRVEIEDDAHYEYTMKYCPNCGAKMDLEE